MEVQELVDRFNEHCQEYVHKMQAVSSQCDIETVPICDTPGLSDLGSENVYSHIMKWANNHSKQYVSFATEAGLFQKSGISTIVCGPGSINQAHKPNEFIDIAQIDACVSFMKQLTWDLSGC